LRIVSIYSWIVAASPEGFAVPERSALVAPDGFGFCPPDGKDGEQETSSFRTRMMARLNASGDVEP
jgi:hypothetical protein